MSERKESPQRKKPRTTLKKKIISDFHNDQWYNEFIKPQKDKGYEAAAALCVYSEVQRLRYKKTLSDCYKFYENYLLDDKTFDYKKFIFEIQKNSDQSESRDSELSKFFQKVFLIHFALQVRVLQLAVVNDLEVKEKEIIPVIQPLVTNIKVLE